MTEYQTQSGIVVSAAGATHYAVNAPASATAGTSFNINVTALDAFNNVVTGYNTSDGKSPNLTNGFGQSNNVHPGRELQYTLRFSF